MTTSNGSGRIVERVDGQVTSANERGVKLAGEDAYRNFSKYADPPIAPPTRGQQVSLGLDGSGFVRELVILDAAAAALSNSAAPSSTRDRTITKLAVLKAAAEFCGHYSTVREDVKSSDVLKIADAWLAWVEKGDEPAEPF